MSDIPMRWLAVALLFASSCLGGSRLTGDEPTPARAPFLGKIVLFGAQRPPKVSGTVELLTLDPESTQLESVLKLENVALMAGRISPDGKRLAFSTLSSQNRTWTTWIVDGTGQRREVPGAGQVKAWSPSGLSLACFRPQADRGGENFLVDLETGKANRLEIPADDVFEDWSHAANLVSVMAANGEHTFEHPGKGTYPLRQLDVMAPDGTRKLRITKDGLLDNIWSRFSPDGTLIAHYQRRHSQDKVLENYVVRKRQEGDAIEVVRCDKLDENLREVPSYPSYPYYWTPQGPPAWSPDGSCIATCVSNGKWARGESDKLRFGLVFASPEGTIKRTLELDRIGVAFVSQIDWR